MGTFKVDDLKEDPTMWYLPHFPVMTKDKAATKGWIVFAAAAKTNVIYLNDVTHQGPKLKRDFL